MTERRIRVLIVDDFAETRENIRKLLQLQPDIEVVGTAGNGLEAVRLYEDVHPDVVSMDTNMPYMDGITATELICSRHKHAKIFILSVNNEPTVIRRAMEAGAKGFLALPPTPNELIGIVRRTAGAPLSDENTSLRVPASVLGTKPRDESRSTVYVRTRIIAADRKPRAAVLRDLGDIALDAADYDEAYNFFSRAVDADPLDYRAWLGKTHSLSRRAGWEDLENAVYVYLTEALAVAENSTGNGTAPKAFAPEYARHSEEITRTYSEAYTRRNLKGDSPTPANRNRGWAESRFETKQHEARIRFYLSCAITLSWEVFPSKAGGCLIGELLEQWWRLRLRALAGLTVPAPQALGGQAIPDAEPLRRSIQGWIWETYAESWCLRSRLDPEDRPPETRFTHRMARWVLEVLGDTRGYRNRILQTTWEDLDKTAASFYPELLRIGPQADQQP